MTLFATKVSIQEVTIKLKFGCYILKTHPSALFPLVAGNWSNWGVWSACSETCGNGTRNRTRLCNNPTPAHGGAACQGDANNTEACLVRYCPSKSNLTHS